MWRPPAAPKSTGCSRIRSVGDRQGPHGASQYLDHSHHHFNGLNKINGSNKVASNTPSNPTRIPGRFGHGGIVPLVPTSLLPSRFHLWGLALPCSGASTPRKKNQKSSKSKEEKWFWFFVSIPSWDLLNPSDRVNSPSQPLLSCFRGARGSPGLAEQKKPSTSHFSRTRLILGDTCIYPGKSMADTGFLFPRKTQVL